MEKTIEMWPGVCAGEDQFIKVFKQEADLLLDTSFSYEICALAPLVKEAFDSLEETSAAHPRIAELMLKFAPCRPIGLELLPKSSMLQEFLGTGEV